MDAATAEHRALVSRLINVEIRGMVPPRDWVDPDEWDFLCECGHCRDRVALLPAEFDRRVAADELILVPGHIYAAAAEARRIARKLRKEAEALRAQSAQAIRQARKHRPPPTAPG
jgi:hypothetical protein